MRRQLWAKPEAMVKLNGLMTDLTSRTGASGALMIDDSGILITRHGRMPAGDPSETASLLACNFLVTHELAEYLGDEEITTLFHEGENKNIYMKRVGDHGIVVLMFEDTGALGRVRLMVEKAATQLGILLNELERDFLPLEALPSGFRELAERAISKFVIESKGQS